MPGRRGRAEGSAEPAPKRSRSEPVAQGGARADNSRDASAKGRERGRGKGKGRGKGRGGREGSQLPETWLERVAKQVEFWFSDANLRRDRFMREKIQEGNGFIPLTLLLEFNRLKALRCFYISQLQQALRKSDILVLNGEKTMVRRDEEKAPVEQVDEGTIVQRSIYVEGLPLSFTVDTITQFLARYGRVRFVDIPRHRETKEPRGCCFAEFAIVEEASAAIAAIHGSWPSSWAPRYDGRTLRAMTKLRFDEFKAEYRTLANTARASGGPPGTEMPSQRAEAQGAEPGSPGAPVALRSGVALGGGGAPSGDEAAQRALTESEGGASGSGGPASQRTQMQAETPGFVAGSESGRAARDPPRGLAAAAETPASPSAREPVMATQVATAAWPCVEVRRGTEMPASWRGCLVRISGFSAPQTQLTIRQYAEHAVSVLYCDDFMGTSSGIEPIAHLRLGSPADCQALLEDARCTRRMLGWLRPKLEILDPTEEERYWQAVSEHRAARDAPKTATEKPEAVAACAEVAATEALAATAAAPQALVTAPPVANAPATGVPATEAVTDAVCVLAVAQVALEASAVAAPTGLALAAEAVAKAEARGEAASAPPVTATASAEGAAESTAKAPAVEALAERPRSKRSVKRQGELERAQRLLLHGSVLLGERRRVEIHIWPFPAYAGAKRWAKRRKRPQASATGPRQGGFIDSVCGNRYFSQPGFSRPVRFRRRRKPREEEEPSKAASSTDPPGAKESGKRPRARRAAPEAPFPPPSPYVHPAKVIGAKAKRKAAPPRALAFEMPPPSPVARPPPRSPRLASAAVAPPDGEAVDRRDSMLDDMEDILGLMDD